MKIYAAFMLLVWLLASIATFRDLRRNRYPLPEVTTHEKDLRRLVLTGIVAGWSLWVLLA